MFNFRTEIGVKNSTSKICHFMVLHLMDYVVYLNVYVIVLIYCCRNMFTYLGSILVFIVILILLLKYNNGSSTLNQEDKKIFWVSN